MKMMKTLILMLLVVAVGCDDGRDFRHSIKLGSVLKTDAKSTLTRGTKYGCESLTVEVEKGLADDIAFFLECDHKSPACMIQHSILFRYSNNQFYIVDDGLSPQNGVYYLHKRIDDNSFFIYLIYDDGTENEGRYWKKYYVEAVLCHR